MGTYEDFINLGVKTKGKPNLKRQLTYRQKILLWEKRSHICPVCHKKINSFTEADFHHIKPFSKGGKTIPSNIRIEHTKCHRGEKGHRGTRKPKKPQIKFPNWKI